MIKTETTKKIYSLHVETDLTQDFRNYNLYNLALKYINSIEKNVRLLDIGAGGGEFLNLLPKCVKGFGVEPSPELRRLAQRRFSIKINFKNIDEIIDTYDVITMFDVLEHIENDRSFLKRIVELMNNNGLLIIAVPSLNFLYGNRDYVTGHYRRYDYHQLKFLFKEMNFHTLVIRY